MKGVPSAGWRIREIPDCASSPKTHSGAARYFEQINAFDGWRDHGQPRLPHSNGSLIPR